jgi:peptidoglycan/LPS O-acetylase OafA/YrhL
MLNITQKITAPFKLNTNRNFGLDFIRSIAILLVLIAHLGVDDQVVGGLKIGGLGVEIFFVLSGFLIGQILIKILKKTFTWQVVLDFWIRRWLRTLPLYYAVIILKFLFFDHTYGMKILVYFLFLQNNFVGIGFMPVTWSLVIEEWFYITLPILLYIVFYKKAITPNKLVVFIVCFIATISMARFGFVTVFNRGFEGITGNFPFRLDSLMMGVLLAHIKLNFQKIHSYLITCNFFVFVLIIYCMLLVSFASANSTPNNINTLVWTRTFWFILNSFCIALLIPFIESKITTSSAFFKQLITAISVFSYCAYLIHMEVYRLFLSAAIFSFQWFMQAFISISIVFMLSNIIYAFYEKPMTDLRERFKK